MDISIGGFEVTLPVFVLGVISGTTYGLLAIGLVLIYRSNRVINFAHGQIGASAAVVLGLLVTQSGVPYWIAFPLALVLGAGIGAVSELGVMRRLRKAPSAMSIIALLGLGQLLLFLSLAVSGLVTAAYVFPAPPWLPSFNIGALRVTPEYSGMLILSPMLAIGLALFLRRSRYGLAIRASASNPDKARLSGVFASRMSTLSWAIAGAVSAFTAILLLPTQGTGSVELLGPSLLIRALAAGVLARMHSLPIALAGGVVVGVVEQTLLWNYRSAGLVEVVLFLGILTALLFQRRQAGRHEEKGSWVGMQAWPPIPESLLRVRSIRNLGRTIALVSLVVAIAVPALLTNRFAVVMTAIVAFGIVGLSIGIVTGLSGQLSLGQFALAGVGAAFSYMMVRETGNIFLGLIAAGLGASALSLIIALPALRIRGLMLTVTTLGFAAAAELWLFSQSWMFGAGVPPGDVGIGTVTLQSSKAYYFFALPVLVLALLLARNVWRTGLGRQLRAIRDNEDAARGFTVSVTSMKLLGFVVAGFLAGIGGAVFGHALGILQPRAFPLVASINVVAMTVLGGMGLLVGPLIGAFYIIGLPRWIPLDNAGLAATSLGWLLLILYFPGGIAQVLRPQRDRLIGWLARRAGVDPAAEEGDLVEAPRAGAIQASSRASAPPQTHEPLLVAVDLTKNFGGVRAVDGVSLSVRAGETVGLIGPNGAGKTTLFELIAGFTNRDSGSVFFAGTDVSDVSPERRGRLGLIRSFQDASLFPTMTVLDAVKLSLERSDRTRFVPSILGMGGAERRKDARARELVAAMGLNHYRNKQISELSTGTRRITELTCMVALEPTMLLLDEPSSGIAQRETEKLGGLLKNLQRELGLTMVIIEHDIPLIMELADRVIAMESGRILAEGTPTEIQANQDVIESYLGGNALAIQRSGGRVSTTQ